MQEIKAALESLNSALCLLRDGIAKTKEKEKEQDAQQLKIDEQAKIQGDKVRELDTREGKLKHIESIDEATKEAVALKEEARGLMANQEKVREKLEVDLKNFAKVKADFDKEQASIKETNRLQVEALQQERKEFDDKVKAYKAMAAAVK